MNSTELRGFLTGLIYGDARIDSGIRKRALRLKTTDFAFGESIKYNLDISTNFHTSLYNYEPYIDKNGVNHKESWEVYVKAHPYFNKMYHHFYDDFHGRKASADSMRWLTPMGLAYWYMSDGYVCLVGKESGRIRARRVDFCTDRYPEDTVNSLRYMLQKRFGLETSVIKRGKFQRIRVKKDSYLNFYNIVSPYIIPSMRYKLYLGYEFQPKWMPDTMWKEQVELHSAVALT